VGYVFIALTVLLTCYAQVILKYEINSVPNMPSGLPMIGFLVKFTLFRPFVLLRDDARTKTLPRRRHR
jgi:hypothetical protein